MLVLKALDTRGYSKDTAVVSYEICPVPNSNKGRRVGWALSELPPKHGGERAHRGHRKNTTTEKSDIAQNIVMLPHKPAPAQIMTAKVTLKSVRNLLGDRKCKLLDLQKGRDCGFLSRMVTGSRDWSDNRLRRQYSKKGEELTHRAVFVRTVTKALDG